MENTMALRYVEPRGVPNLVFDEPDGSFWGTASDLENLVVDPLGTGSSGGSAVNSMTRDLTDSENYVSTHYPLSFEIRELQNHLTKHMLAYVLRDDPAKSQNQQTYVILPVYWINIFGRRAFESGKIQLQNLAYKILTERYPKALPQLTNLREQVNTGAFGGFTNDSTNEEDEDSLSDGNPQKTDDSDSEASDGLVRAWRKPKQIKIDESKWINVNIPDGGEYEHIQRLLADFFREHLSTEDMSFIETHAKGYSASSGNVPAVLEDLKNATRFDVQPWKYNYSQRGYEWGKKIDSARYENQYRNHLAVSRKASLTIGFVDSNTMRDLTFNKTKTTARMAKLGEVEKIILETASVRQKSIREQALKGSKLSTKNANNIDTLSSWSDYLDISTKTMTELDKAVSEIKGHIRAAVASPSHTIVGSEGAGNYIPWLFRGGQLENFAFLGGINTMTPDNTNYHEFNNFDIAIPLPKIVPYREQFIFNLWGDKLPVGSKLWMVTIRGKLSELPRLGNRFDPRVQEDSNPNNTPWNMWLAGNEQQYDKPQNHLNSTFDCNSLSKKTYGKYCHSQGWCGWNDWTAFEKVPMTWGNREPNIDDLRYIDIWGNEAIAHVEPIGSIRIDYLQGGGPFPWSDLEMALGRPNYAGIEPTFDMCKEAMMRLPRIPVLINHMI